MLSSSFSTLLLHPLSTLFPYTTLFRSNVIGNPILPVIKLCANPRTVRLMPEHIDVDVSGITRREINMDQRSEEHTSELQSLTNLVCRLLLEKKNNTTRTAQHGILRSAY